MEGANATPLESLFAMTIIGYHTIVPRGGFQGLRPWTPPKGLIPLESLYAMTAIEYHKILPREPSKGFAPGPHQRDSSLWNPFSR